MYSTICAMFCDCLVEGAMLLLLDVVDIDLRFGFRLQGGWGWDRPEGVADPKKKTKGRELSNAVGRYRITARYAQSMN